MTDDFKKSRNRECHRENMEDFFSNQKTFFFNKNPEEYFFKNKMQLLANEIKMKIITK